MTVTGQLDFDLIEQVMTVPGFNIALVGAKDKLPVQIFYPLKTQSIFKPMTWRMRNYRVA